MCGESKGFRKSCWNEFLLILVFLMISLVVGILLADDYGLSWDENDNISYSEIVIKAYQGSEDFIHEGKNAKYYGPFYWMMVHLVYKFVKTILLSVNLIHVWKISSFLVFQIAVITFYKLCRIFVPKIPALFISILFMTQPLLWGHSFINQKDIPLMTFFLISITLGLYGIDNYHRYLQLKEGVQQYDRWDRVRGRWRAWRLEWNTAKRCLKIVMLLLLLLFVYLSIELILVRNSVLPQLKAIVRDAYHGESIALINSLFEIIAQDAYKSPLNLYLIKAERLYDSTIIWVLLGLFLISNYVHRKIFNREQRSSEWRKRIIEVSHILVPAIALGLTISIRVAGLFAGILISGYFLYRARSKAIIPLIVYWIVAACVSYATWPYLWGAPIPRFLESIQEAGGFESLKTLFQGTIQASESMPMHYLPFLLLAQLTEPTIILILFGLIIVIHKWRRREVELAYLLLIAAWIVVPILAEILLRVPIYDNFRQFLFVVPPLILISSWGAAFLYEQLKPNWLAVILLVIVILPGIWGLVVLHPYEYVYYNIIVGGVDGAYGEYELDYWCTSLKEAIEFLNEYAFPSATVYVSGPIDAATPYAREDLKFVRDRSRIPYPDYVVPCRNVVLDERFYPDYQIIHEVGLGRGVFAVIKEKVSDP